MATYGEVSALLSRSGDGTTVTSADVSNLRGRVLVATLIKCGELRDEAYVDPLLPTTAELRRKIFAQQIYRSTSDRSAITQPDFERVYRTVILSNRAATVAQILGASDTAVQTNVNTAVEFFSTTYTSTTP